MQDTNHKLSIVQHNTARSYPITQSLLQTAYENQIDVVLVQEPAYSPQMDLINHPAYIGILPNYPYSTKLPRAAAYWRKESRFKYTQVDQLCRDPDVLVLQINGPGLRNFKLINVYNENIGDKPTGEAGRQSISEIHLPTAENCPCTTRYPNRANGGYPSLRDSTVGQSSNCYNQPR